MNFRSYSDLERCIARQLHQIPRDVDLIVGIPRSGWVAAVPLALHLNVPLTDPEGLVAGRLLSTGRRLEHRDYADYIANARRILVVDDSLCMGSQIKKTRNFLAGYSFSEKLQFMAVYVASSQSANEFVDLWLEECPMPRMFGWNVMHHSSLIDACVDIDGVLCVDPTEEENDDGEKYLSFILNAKPLYLPSVPIGSLVTSRLEKYRHETEAWLKAQGISYKELVMWDLPSKEARQALGTHGEFKGKAYRERSWANIFIESNSNQAYEIAQTSRKPVICIETQQKYDPSLNSLVKGVAKKSGLGLGRKLDDVKVKVKNYLMALNRW